MEIKNKNLLMNLLAATIVGAVLVNIVSGEGIKKNASFRQKSKEAFEYCKTNKMDTSFCIMADMSVHSGKKRMVVWDFKGDTIQRLMLVSHGSAGMKGLAWSTVDKPVFSNIPNSHYSSLGKYRIGNRGWSNWGIHVNYKIHGLESTNNKAFNRVVVLHSWSIVSDDEVYPEASPYSWGCPAVSDNEMKYLDSLLKTKKDVMLWIYK